MDIIIIITTTIIDWLIENIGKGAATFVNYLPQAQ